MISVVIHTFNNQPDIAYAVRSVTPWADEVVVVDMHSDDGTAEVAARLGARVVPHERLGCADPARAFGLAQCRGDWILALDADEVVPPRVGERLREIAERDEADVVWVPRVNYLFGAPLRHGGWGPGHESHPRYCKRAFLRFEPRLHHTLNIRQGGRRLDLPRRPEWALLHFNCVGIAQHLQKLNNYTTIEAAQALERGERPRPWRTAYLMAKELGRRYVALAGFRDGWRGAYVAAAMVLYQLASQAKLERLIAMGSDAEIQRRYGGVAEAALAGGAGRGRAPGREGAEAPPPGGRPTPPRGRGART
jgi:glycosyltransferase involved in cell wall biosynthesis